GALVVAATGTFQSTKNITGNTTSSARTRQGGTYSLTGGSGALPPLLLEAMSQDRGAVTDGYRDNFPLGRLSIGGKVKLQDLSDNAQGTGAEVMYVDSLVVPSGTTLDLNGLKLYTRISSIQGTITGGTITTLSDGGPILFALPTS